jgi:hypothetical protein
MLALQLSFASLAKKKQKTLRTTIFTIENLSPLAGPYTIT